MGQAEQTYALPLDDVIDVIQVLGASAVTAAYQAQADVPAGLLPSAVRRGHHFFAEVVIHVGQPVSCVIREQGSNTTVLEGAKAFEAVRSRVQLVWNVRPIDAPTAPASPAPQAGSTTVSLAPPARSRWFTHPPVKRERTIERIRQIPDRKQRMVCLLIDGQRTVDELAALLQMSPSDVQEILDNLAAQGWIE